MRLTLCVLLLIALAAFAGVKIPGAANPNGDSPPPVATYKADMQNGEEVTITVLDEGGNLIIVEYEDGTVVWHEWEIAPPPNQDWGKGAYFPVPGAPEPYDGLNWQFGNEQPLPGGGGETAIPGAAIRNNQLQNSGAFVRQ